MYISNIYNKKFDFPINKKLSIVIGENGSYKSTCLMALEKYFLKNNENVLFFPEIRFFDKDPKKIIDHIYSYITINSIDGTNIYEQLGVNKEVFNYNIKNLESYFLEYIDCGNVQLINFIGQILMNENNNLIVIIDTPETSLDIYCKRKLIEIITNFDKVKQLIVCTHSPEIIGKNYKDIVEINTCLT